MQKMQKMKDAKTCQTKKHERCKNKDKKKETNKKTSQTEKHLLMNQQSVDIKLCNVLCDAQDMCSLPLQLPVHCNTRRLSQFVGNSTLGMVARSTLGE